MSFQCLQVLNALRSGPKTTLQLVESLHVMSLTRRIHELRKAGHVITSTERKQNGRRVVTYRLEP